MKPEDFERLANLLKRRSGLVITPDKGYLVESRLAPVAQKYGLKDLAGLLSALAHGDENLAKAVTEAMTTNETSWFRDNTPFDIFRKVLLPEMLERRAATRNLRIWSAAASTGQEAYSLAMILKEEAAKLQGWKIEIVGTDISQEVLTRAKSGVYTQFEVQRGLPIQMLVKYFKQDGDKWQIAPEIRNMVQYREFNLLEDPMTLGRFDVVFCRNVLIYFDQPTKSTILERISRLLASDGLLYLGGAETVLGVSERFEPLAGHRGIYAIAAVANAPKLAATA